MSAKTLLKRGRMTATILPLRAVRRVLTILSGGRWRERRGGKRTTRRIRERIRDRSVGERG